MLRIALVIGLLGAVGRFAIDIALFGLVALGAAAVTPRGRPVGAPAVR